MTLSTRNKARMNTGVAVAAAIAALSVISVLLHARVAAEPERVARPPVPVVSEAYVLQEGYNREQRFLGLVQAATRSQVGFEVPGAIAEILVEEGQPVDAGAALARLDTQSLLARQSAAASTVKRVEAELELARGRTERQRPLQESGAISAQNFDDTRLAEKALASALDAAKAELQAVQIDIEKSTLRAPYPARVGRQLLDRGAVTRPGQAVFTLISTAEREAHVGIAVEQAQHLAAGDAYILEWRDRSIPVVLRGVRPDVNPVSMTTTAIFNLPPQVQAFDGEPVAIRLPRREAQRGGWLPLSALLEGERGIWTVLALRDEGSATVALREVVEVLHVSDDRAYVRGTLNAGDRVITDGIHRIAPGTRVRDVQARSTAVAEI